MGSRISFSVNGRSYDVGDTPVVVICIDGGDAAYLQSGWERGQLPTFRRFAQQGFYGLASGTVPSFTCPNNMSIITGAPASVHGISGNFYLEPETGQPVPMTGPELLRAPTILSACVDAGGRVACVTAKDKLRLQLQKGLDLSSGRHVSVSVEKAHHCNRADNGISDVLGLIGRQPADMYSAELSIQVLEIGLALLRKQRFNLVYLSLSDYVQHKHAPGEVQADLFYQALDKCLAQIDATGAVIALCADHGMNDKSDADGNPQIVFVQDYLDREFGRGRTRVICPITDAFVKHHGALGGFVRVWLGLGAPPVPAVIRKLKMLRGIEMALTREQACEIFSLPEDREADIVLIATRDHALGAARSDHDLTGLAGKRLRTHGSTSEAIIPVLINRQLDPSRLLQIERYGLRNHDVFDLAINAAAA